MHDDLTDLRDKLQTERQEVVARLKQIDNDLASIERVLDLMGWQKDKRNKSQLSFVDVQQSPTKFANLSFSQALLILFRENPKKYWTPKEITSVLSKNGFETKSKDFGATVRSMLGVMKKKRKVHAMQIDKGWMYGPKEKGSIPSAEPDPSMEPKHNGEVGERLKPANL